MYLNRVGGVSLCGPYSCSLMLVGELKTCVHQIHQLLLDCWLKRGLEYGARAPVFYGNLREQTGEDGVPPILHKVGLF